jgi:predicted dehydrogenase
MIQMKLRGAILGLGNIARLSHVPTWLKFGDAVEIVAGADMMPQNRAEFLKMCPQARVYQDGKDLLSAEEPDFVDICTPPSSHTKFILNAAASGCHILCEKPLCTSIAEAGQIEKAIWQSDSVFLPCHQYRYSQQWLKIERVLDRGVIGEPKFWRVNVERQRPNPGNPHWKPDWRREKTLSGGGIVLDHGSHLFYLGRMLFGEPRQIEARLSYDLSQNPEVEDTAQVIIRHQNAVSELSMTWAGSERKTEQTLRGSKGEAVLFEKSMLIRNLDGREMEVITWDEGLSGDSAHSGWYEGLLKIFLACIREKRLDRSPLDEAIYVMRCVHLVYLSGRLGKTISYGVEYGTDNRRN